MLKHFLAAFIAHLTSPRLEVRLLGIERFFINATPIVERVLHIAVQGSMLVAQVLYVIVVIILILRFLIHDLGRLL